MDHSSFWQIAWAIGFGVFFLFTFVIIYGAPFLPTMKKQLPEAIKLLDLKPGQTMLELGCGDGRMLIEAAKNGINAVGYELNPLLFVYCWLRTRKYKRKIKVILGNYWRKQWPEVEGIFVFLLSPYMERLNTKIIQTYKSKVKLVSFAYPIKSKNPVKTKTGLYLYIYNG
ncbi:MAG TPA: hypothetical protein VMR34_01600 [Candidatus Saccharimonadales bacterium]|nr:hypothetical protein [Candidatus Saccharimonadales bacterium]